MTTNNTKKLSNIKLLFVLVATIALVSVGTTYVSAEPITEISGEKVTTITDKEVLDLSEETSDLYEKYKPESINEIQKTNYDRIVLNDSRIQEKIKDKTFEITGYTHEGNLKTNPGVWDVLVHMKVDDRVVVAKINAETNEVDFVSDKAERKLLPNGFAVDWYSGSKTLNGVQMRSDAPNYNHESGADYTALLINAVKSGSNDPYDLCDDTKDPTSYWMQTGYIFDSDDLEIVWTDTNQECVAQTLSTTVPSAGQEMRFRIYITDSSNQWTGVAYNTVTGFTASVTKTVSGSSTLATDTPNTSVFFENSNTSTTNDWDDGFAADPYVDSAHYRKTTHSGWFYWDVETKGVVCPSPPPTTSQLMSGTFVGSPHKVTFDVSDIANLCEED